ncbi:MAG: hypothetical protein V1789_02105 [PVC group bacterium]
MEKDFWAGGARAAALSISTSSVNPLVSSNSNAVAFWTPLASSFAHGGKDDHPYPVDRENYDQSISILEELLNKSRVDYYEKRRAFARLSRMK